MALPTALYSTAQVRGLDAHAISELGIPGYTLMKRAGEAALRYLRTRWPMAHRIVIVCGGGNNGGDGFVAARRLAERGHRVRLLLAGNDITVIALWLGHEQVTTTQIYLHADMSHKQRAIERTRPPGVKPGRYRPSDTMLAFLQAL